MYQGQYTKHFILHQKTNDGDYYLCQVEQVLGGGENDGKYSDVFYKYPKSMFEENFHGTLITFTKDRNIINEIKEIKKNFPIHFGYVTSLNVESWAFSASDGVIYNFDNNYFCNHNLSTKNCLKRDLLKCNDFYALAKNTRDFNRA